MSKKPRFAKRIAAKARYYARGLVQQLGDKDIFIWAQAIGFKVLVTIVPVVILATGVLGQALRRERPFEWVAQLIRDVMPSYRIETIIGFLEQLGRAAPTLLSIGSVALVVWSVTLLSTLRGVLANIFREEWHEHRSIIGGYVFDLRLVLQTGVLLVATIAFSVFVRTINTWGLEQLQGGGPAYFWLRQGWREFFRFSGLIIPFLLTTGMFFQLFYLIPIPRPPKRSVLIGTLVTAVLWEAAKHGFTLYATNVGAFNRYADGAGGITALGDTFGLIIAFVVWAYYSGLVLIIGAIVVLLHETHDRMIELRTRDDAGRERLKPVELIQAQVKEN